MADIRKRFDVPVPFFYQKIDIELRKKLFKTIVDDMSKHNNSLKFMAAYLNWNMENLYDYFMIYETTNVSGKPFVMVKLATLGDRFSIQGFYYCIIHDKTKEYFEDIFEALIPFERNTFNNFIESMGLSFTKGQSNYWKNPDNLTAVGTRILEITKIYNPQIQVMR